MEKNMKLFSKLITSWKNIETSQKLTVIIAFLALLLSIFSLIKDYVKDIKKSHIVLEQYSSNKNSDSIVLLIYIKNEGNKVAENINMNISLPNEYIGTPKIQINAFSKDIINISENDLIPKNNNIEIKIPRLLDGCQFFIELNINYRFATYTPRVISLSTTEENIIGGQPSKEKLSNYVINNFLNYMDCGDKETEEYVYYKFQDYRGHALIINKAKSILDSYNGDQQYYYRYLMVLELLNKIATNADIDFVFQQIEKIKDSKNDERVVDILFFLIYNSELSNSEIKNILDFNLSHMISYYSLHSATEISNALLQQKNADIAIRQEIVNMLLKIIKDSYDYVLIADLLQMIKESDNIIIQSGFIELVDNKLIEAYSLTDYDIEKKLEIAEYYKSANGLQHIKTFIGTLASINKEEQYNELSNIIFTLTGKLNKYYIYDEKTKTISVDHSVFFAGKFLVTVEWYSIVENLTTGSSGQS
jgi:hypothetical protein